MNALDLVLLPSECSECSCSCLLLPLLIDARNVQSHPFFANAESVKARQMQSFFYKNEKNSVKTFMLLRLCQASVKETGKLDLFLHLPLLLLHVLMRRLFGVGHLLHGLVWAGAQPLADLSHAPVGPGLVAVLAEGEQDKVVLAGEEGVDIGRRRAGDDVDFAGNLVAVVVELEAVSLSVVDKFLRAD